MMTTALLIFKYPQELCIREGAPVHLASSPLITSMDRDDLYEEFYIEFLKWRQLDIDTMQSEIEGAKQVANETLSQTPPDKDWFSEWERGTELQKSVLDVAKHFLEKCKDNPPGKI